MLAHNETEEKPTFPLLSFLILGVKKITSNCDMLSHNLQVDPVFRTYWLSYLHAEFRVLPLQTLSDDSDGKLLEELLLDVQKHVSTLLILLKLVRDAANHHLNN